MDVNVGLPCSDGILKLDGLYEVREEVFLVEGLSVTATIMDCSDCENGGAIYSHSHMIVSGGDVAFKSSLMVMLPPETIMSLSA